MIHSYFFTLLSEKLNIGCSKHGTDVAKRKYLWEWMGDVVWRGCDFATQLNFYFYLVISNSLIILTHDLELNGECQIRVNICSSRLEFYPTELQNLAIQ